MNSLTPVHESGLKALPLYFRVIEEARILAFQKPGPRRDKYCGGLVLGDSEDDRRLRQLRPSGPVDTFDLSAGIEARLNGHYAYGGRTNRHFGHFMAEMVHRILPSRLHDPRQNFVFVSWAGNPENSYDSLPKFVQQVYSFLGLKPAQVTILTCNTVVESLFVSESGSTMGEGPKEAYLDMLDGYTIPQLDTAFGSARSGKRIYVSRTRVKKPGGLCGEGYLESALAAEGYEIFHPQDHPFAVQMDEYRKADIVIFAEGSACHGTELLGRDAMGTCILIPRRGESRQFDRVLKPRARQFRKAPSCVYLGTTHTRPDGREAHSRGVAVLDWEALAQFLRDIGAAKLQSTAKDAYMAAAEEDFSRYVEDSASRRGPSKNAHLFTKLADRFNALR